MNFIQNYIEQVAKIAETISCEDIERMVEVIKSTRSQKGRIFFLGVGGSAANCSHAVNDFRKLANFECYAPTDNVSELSARTNDDGWDTVFSSWLDVSNLCSSDCVFIFSVGGGNKEKRVSINLINAMDYARDVGASVIGIVGKQDGYLCQVADAHVVIPIVDKDLITPHSEAFQAIVWHLIVSHPDVKVNETKW